MMTAANLGARVTGWGFVVFTIGSVCWSIIGISTGQTNLVATNAFLTFVNLVGIWRWLGRQRSYEDGARSATQASLHSSGPDLVHATGIAGVAIVDASGEPLGKGVEALIECGSGSVRYVVVATGGVGGISEELRAVPGNRIAFGAERLTLKVSRRAFEALPVLADGEWPVRVTDEQARQI